MLLFRKWKCQSMIRAFQRSFPPRSWTSAVLLTTQRSSNNVAPFGAEEGSVDFSFARSVGKSLGPRIRAQLTFPRPIAPAATIIGEALYHYCRFCFGRGTDMTHPRYKVIYTYNYAISDEERSFAERRVLTDNIWRAGPKTPSVAFWGVLLQWILVLLSHSDGGH